MRYYICLLFIFLVLTGCNSKENTNSLFAEVYDNLPFQPELAAKHLEDIPGSLSPSERATFDLLSLYIYDLQTFGYYSDSLTLKILRNSHHYNDDRQKALWLYYKGVYLIRQGEYHQAIETFHLSEQTARQRGDDFLLGLIYERSAEVFYDRALFNTTIRYSEKSNEHFMDAGDPRNANRALAWKLYALLDLNEHSEAESLYTVLKDNAVKYSDTDFLRSLADVLILLYLSYEDTDKASEVNNDLIKICPSCEPLPIQYVLAADVKIGEGKLSDAKLALSKAETMISDPFELATLHQVYIKYYKAVDDYKSAMASMEEHISVYDSLYNIKQRLSLVHLEGRAQNFQLEYNLKKSVILRQRILFGSITAVLLLFVIILAHRRKIKQQRRELDSRIAIVSDLKESNQSLLTKLDIHQEKENRLKEEIESKLNYAKMMADLYYKFPDKPGTIIRRLNEMMDMAPANKEFTASLINTVNVYYNNAIDRLTEKHPSLNNPEILFSALIIAGFSINEMALILNRNSVDAVYTRKYRLRSKLGLPKNVELETYLAAFSGENTLS